MSVDAFEGRLAGLVLAEIELADEAAFAAFEIPAFALADVSGDDRFTGGSLAAGSRIDVRSAVADLVGRAQADRLLPPP
jgi:CYTH domain-containing protein